MTIPPDSADPRLRGYLDALPAPAAPAALAPRILSLQRRHRRRRRLGLTTVALAVVAAALLPLLQPTPSGTDAAALATGGDTTAPVSVGGAAAPHPAHREVRALDRALQAAYERGADDIELAGLWRERERALETAGDDTAILPVRI